jgi:hypothetical protein
MAHVTRDLTRIEWFGTLHIEVLERWMDVSPFCHMSTYFEDRPLHAETYTAFRQHDDVSESLLQTAVVEPKPVSRQSGIRALS